MFFEVINEEITKNDFKNNYFHFIKYAYKYKNVNRYFGFIPKYDDEQHYNKEKLEKDFPFFEEEVHKKCRTKIKYSDYPLEYYKMLKNFNYRNFYTIDTKIIAKLKSISNIFKKEEEIKNYANSLIPGSFILYQEFELISPYFSRDDDDFYIIDNPVLKEKVYKVPMIRGSAWKGNLLNSASKILEERIEDETSTIEEIIDIYARIYRIFGTGSEDFRDLKDVLDKYVESKSKNENISTPNLEKQLVKYALFDLGISLFVKRKEKTLISQLIELIDEKIKSSDLKDISVYKGRTVFYPTYFDRITLEVINPHNRKTKAGEFPIYFEVVPEGTKGYLQIIYIPFDAVLLPESEIKKQAKEDIAFIKDIVEKTLTEHGVGAKTKLGWGYAKLIPEGSKLYCNIRGV